MYSIVIPVYNVKPEFLIQCLESILFENVVPIEVIIVDDRSTNGCELICDEYADKDERVQIIHQQRNCGVSEARNTGIRESKGEWIVFIDADDWIESDTFSRLAKQAANDVDIIVFSAYRDSLSASVPFGTADDLLIYSDETGARNSLAELNDKLLKQSLKTTHQRYDTVKYCWGKAFGRKFLLENKINFPELNYCEDIVFMSRAFQKAKKVMQIPARLYHYRVSAYSAVNSYRSNALEEQQRFMALMEDAVGVEGDALYYAALLSMQICITRYFFNRKNQGNVIEKHRRAESFFKSWPYKDVFKHISSRAMKRNEKYKVKLIKHKLYYLYYLGTELKKLKAVRYT